MSDSAKRAADAGRWDHVHVRAYEGPFREAEACRLLWRAGFGPKPGQTEKLARLGLRGAVHSLTRPRGPERVVGPKPTNSQGQPLDPVKLGPGRYLLYCSLPGHEMKGMRAYLVVR